MKNLIILVLFLCLSPISRAESPIFAGIQWGARKEEVRKQLTAKGFTPGLTNKDGDFKFEGPLVGRKAVGMAMFGDNKIAKILIVIITPDNKAIEAYRSMKDVLSKKYGTPDNEYEFFKLPYYDGDGYETQAIQKGKAGVFCSWGSGLSIEIHETLTVQLNYESNAWSDEIGKRKARATSVF